MIERHVRPELRLEHGNDRHGQLRGWRSSEHCRLVAAQHDRALREPGGRSQQVVCRLEPDRLGEVAVHEELVGDEPSVHEFADVAECRDRQRIREGSGEPHGVTDLDDQRRLRRNRRCRGAGRRRRQRRARGWRGRGLRLDGRDDVGREIGIDNRDAAETIDSGENRFDRCSAGCGCGHDGIASAEGDVGYSDAGLGKRLDAGVLE